MNIKSSEFLFAKNSTVESAKKIVIMPTADLRLKIIIIPMECMIYP